MIIGSDWAFIENPRTGSTACRQALVDDGADGTTWRRHLRASVNPDCPATICVVRDPFDRIVSGFHYWPRWATVLDFLNADPITLAMGVDFLREPQTYWAKGAKVLRYETLAKDFKAVFGLKLDVVNKSKRKADYKTMICDDARSIIERRFAPDFDAYGYSW